LIEDVTLDDVLCYPLGKLVYPSMNYKERMDKDAPPADLSSKTDHHCLRRTSKVHAKEQFETKKGFKTTDDSKPCH
jgi:hypothetical protein